MKITKIDKDNTDQVHIQDLLSVLRGPLNDERLFYINCAFHKLDQDANGFIDKAEAIKFFSTSKVPEMNGEVEVEDTAQRFIEEFDIHEKDGSVSWLEFHEVYWNYSISCNEDKKFIKKITHSWRLSSKEIDYCRKRWIPSVVFPQLAPHYFSGTSELTAERMKKMLGAPDESSAMDKMSPSKPTHEKPSSHSLKAANARTLELSNKSPEVIVIHCYNYY